MAAAASDAAVALALARALLSRHSGNKEALLREAIDSLDPKDGITVQDARARLAAMLNELKSSD
jgi:hypothetical protein